MVEFVHPLIEEMHAQGQAFQACDKLQRLANKLSLCGGNDVMVLHTSLECAQLNEAIHHCNASTTCLFVPAFSRMRSEGFPFNSGALGAEGVFTDFFSRRPGEGHMENGVGERSRGVSRNGVR